MNKSIAIIATLLILLLVNTSIYKKEQHITSGKEVWLELAPLDPRSLMQGDYMRLRFKLANEVQQHVRKQHQSEGTPGNHDGYAVITLDDRKVAKVVSISTPKAEQYDQTLHIKYRHRDGRVKFATDSFFFQEGTAKAYDKAKYGVFRVDKEGEMILIDMADEGFTRITPKLSASSASPSSQ